MPEVIYVRGAKGHKGCAAVKTNELTPEEHVWEYAHPRRKRFNTILTLFDYVEGKRKHWSDWSGELPPLKNGTKAPPTKEVSLRSVSDNCPNQEERCASVIAFYDYVKSLGNTAPGSLIELQFFTHGWQGGPILIDTNETREYDRDLRRRDPCDKDTRLKDFDIADVLGGESGVAFRRAFYRDAFVKLWGCTYIEDGGQRRMVRSYYRTKDERERKRILNAYLRYIRDSTYQYRLTHLLGIPVYAAPVGWGTDPDLPFGIDGEVALKMAKSARYQGIFPPRKGDKWWRVSAFFGPDRGRQFYQEVLKAQLDPLDYVRYTDAIISRLSD